MEQKTSNYKRYEELEFKDDFMFGKVMQDTELCHDVLECLLQQPVGELQEITPQKDYRYTADGKPIRLDIYTKDENEIYDAEMQNKGHKKLEDLALPKRSRFYQSSIDTDYLEKSYSYKTLPRSTILFICTFDPFEKNLGKYTFTPKCEEDNSIALDDGTKRIFYNCTYKGDDIPEDLSKLYKYIESGRSEDSLTKRIDNAVMEARKREEWRSSYMKEMTVIMDAKDEGREEEKKNTERERQRADAAEARANSAEARANSAEIRANSAEARIRELEAQLQNR